MLMVWRIPGKNISQEQLVDAMMVGVSQDRSISVGLFAAAVRTNPSGDNASFSLPDLGRHNILEHDASLRYAPSHVHP